MRLLPVTARYRTADRPSAGCEAIASGRWEVASDVDGMREVISNGINGTLVGDGIFAAALGTVPDYDPHAVARTAAAFSVEHYRRGLDDLWRRILADR